MENFHSKHIDILNKIKNDFVLGTFNEDNSYLYFDAFLNLLDNSNKYISYEVEDEFRTFFDILDGTLKNKKIATMVQEINEEMKTTSTMSMNSASNAKHTFATDKKTIVGNESISRLADLSLLIPTHNTLFETFNELISEEITPLAEIEAHSGMVSTFGLAGTALNKAVDYATKHAESRNGKYHSFSADCTNFTSQILEAAGVKQVVSASEHSGWWHKLVSDSWELRHTHSVSWVRADTFARYMGIGKKAYNIRQLGDMVVRGDFIAVDYTGNGSWDHVAFVTAVDSYYATYSDDLGNSYYYKDFRVAQHTTDYLRYVSHKNNNWEKFPSGRVVALVRR